MDPAAHGEEMTGATPLVSIITPAYNAAAHIGDTIRSVLAQTFSRWEWIIVDDGSTDGTCEAVSKIGDPRVTLVRSEHSGIPAVARNKALAVAQGTYVAFLDADDVWTAEKLALQTQCLDAHPDVGLVFSKVFYFYNESGRLRRRPEPSMNGIANPGLLFPHLAFRNLICTSSVVARRSLFDRHGMMDEDPRQRGTEDYELWLRLAPHAVFGWLEQPLVTYRVGSSSLSGNAAAIARGRILALEKALARDANAPLDPRFANGRLEAWKLLWLGQGQLYDGVERCGRDAFRRSLAIDPWNARTWGWLALSFLGARITSRLRALAYRWL
jgi:glycosyltransferase involved in cell wall biosynthesis